MFSIEERVAYYTLNLNKKWEIDFNEKEEIGHYNLDGIKCTYKERACPSNYATYYINKKFSIQHYHKLHWYKFEKGGIGTRTDWEMGLAYHTQNYVAPLIELFKGDSYLKDKGFLHQPGDVVWSIAIPIITKTRPIVPTWTGIAPETDKEMNNILINLESNRHWQTPIAEVKKYDISFNNKNNQILWRGAPNGFLFHATRPSRLTLADKYYNHPNKMIDIGFSSPPAIASYSSGIVKKGIDMTCQLKSKFIISVEGGDVATNLKWILYSNSVPLMAKPTMCSWLMEDKLEPWIHYVPLDDRFDDLEEKYTWCLNNLTKCEEIALNGKKYIEQFMDTKREAAITNLVLRKYVDNVTINLVDT